MTILGIQTPSQNTKGAIHTNMALTLSVTVTVFIKCRLWEAEQHSSITTAGGTLKVTVNHHIQHSVEENTAAAYHGRPSGHCTGQGSSQLCWWRSAWSSWWLGVTRPSPLYRERGMLWSLYLNHSASCHICQHFFYEKYS